MMAPLCFERKPFTSTAHCIRHNGWLQEVGSSDSHAPPSARLGLLLLAVCVRKRFLPGVAQSPNPETFAQTLPNCTAIPVRLPGAAPSLPSAGTLLGELPPGSWPASLPARPKSRL